MAQYKVGTASVTNGSNVVTGTGTSWLSEVTVGNSFLMVGVDTVYSIASVDSNTQVTLEESWAGADKSGSYAIGRDFEPITGAPEMSQGDIETATIFTRAIRKLASAISGLISNHVAETDPHTQYLLRTDYQSDLSREELLKEATLTLDFVNNHYEVYEGPVNNLTERPFNDFLDFTRNSVATARNATGGITSVAVNEQRLVGNREGLLIEEERPNLFTYSEDFGQWSGVTGATRSQSDGFWILNATSGPGQHRIDSPSVDVTVDDPYCFWAVLEKGTSRYVVLNAQAFNFGNNVNTVFDLDAGGVSQQGTSSDDAGVIDLGSGLLLCFVVATAISTGSNEFDIRITDSPTNDLGSFEADGTETINIHRSQCEPGAFPTSYIKTEGSQVTREADACTRTLGPEFNPNEGALFVEATVDAVSGTTYLIDSRISGSNDGIVILVFSGELSTIVRDSDGNGPVISSGVPVVSGQTVKAAVSWSYGSVKFSVNGGIVDTPNNHVLPLSSNLLLRISKSTGTTSNNTTGSLRIYPEALTESELTALTAMEE